MAVLRKQYFEQDKDSYVSLDYSRHGVKEVVSVD